jgi:hypothetical protein
MDGEVEMVKVAAPVAAVGGISALICVGPT